MDLKKIKSIHFVGIKGVAMAALAIVAKEMGKKVTGTDVEEEFPTDRVLRRFSISYSNGFNVSHITAELDLVIYTGAHLGSGNLEVAEAQKRNIPILSHGQALGLFMRGKKGISVAGSHGKTTTSAMIAHVLAKAHLDPSFAIGCGEILSLNTPAHAGKGEYFVAEADEYVTDPQNDPTPRFMWQKPKVLAITNIDFDHPDVYKNIAAVQKAFIAFTNSLSKDSLVIINSDDPHTQEILANIKQKLITFGRSPKADFVAENMEFMGIKTKFGIRHNDSYTPVTLSVPGAHNVHNATAAFAALRQTDLAAQEISKHLESFVGTKRRFELVSEKNGKLLIDDYAHHPAEIRATLAATKTSYPQKRIIAIFQPHTYSRTAALLTEFSQSFEHADLIVLTEIYASAREKGDSKVSGETLYKETKRYQTEVHFAPKKEDVLEYLRTQTRENDLILTMGAGNIFSWLPDIKAIL